MSSSLTIRTDRGKVGPKIERLKKMVARASLALSECSERNKFQSKRSLSCQTGAAPPGLPTFPPPVVGYSGKEERGLQSSMPAARNAHSDLPAQQAPPSQILPYMGPPAQPLHVPASIFRVFFGGSVHNTELHAAIRERTQPLIT